MTRPDAKELARARLRAEGRGYTLAAHRTGWVLRDPRTRKVAADVKSLADVHRALDGLPVLDIWIE